MRFAITCSVVLLSACASFDVGTPQGCRSCLPDIQESLTENGRLPTLHALARSQLNWIGENTDYTKGLDTLPTFIFIPQVLMQRRDWLEQGYRVGGGHYRGFVILPTTFSFTNDDISKVFHEIVHYAQYKNGWAFHSFCDIAREREAYQLQMMWHRQYLDPNADGFGNLERIARVNGC